MDFYQSLGYLILGSRMKRLSEYFLTGINIVYQEEGLAFEASWFPLFYMLSGEQEISIRDISDRLQISHSAVSQLVSNLKKRGLVETNTATGDARKQLVRFTAAGEALLGRIRPVWDGIHKALEDIHQEKPETRTLLSALSGLETAFSNESLSSRIQKTMQGNGLETMICEAETIK